MPENTKFRSIIIEKVEDVSVILLLPLFFVFTGLRTQIGLLDDPYLWKVTAAIIAVAVVGKFFGSALAAKFVGQSWRDSLTIGALMNTRGLMELVVLNIGYDLGVLTAEIFTMMVIMALVTTFMTGPALNLINFVFRNRKQESSESSSEDKFKILFSFGNRERGKSLLRLANSLVKKENNGTLVTGMHLALSNEIHTFNVEEQEQWSFAPVIAESEALNQKIITLFKVSYDIDSDIIEIANQGNYDLLLVGLGQSIFEGSLLGKVLGYTTRIINPDRLIDKFTGKEGLFENSPFDERTRHIISKSKMPVGILVDKDLESPDQIFIPLFVQDDLFLLKYAKMFIRNNNSHITVYEAGPDLEPQPEVTEAINALQQSSANVSVMQERVIKKEFLQQQDMMIMSIESWKKLVDTRSSWLQNMPSVLIIKA